MTAGFSYDGRVRLLWSTDDLADPTAPTSAEIAGAVDLSTYLIAGTFNPGGSNARVAAGDVRSSFDAETPGKRGVKPTAMFKAKTLDGDTLAWETLGTRGTKGTILYFEDVEEGEDPTVGDTCDVYTSAVTLQPLRPASADNTERRFQIDWTVGGDEFQNSVIVGS